ncbi:hypothetical protein BJY01DRAFT_141986 [Aspergillus pseudoustus]|uniref:Bacteriophage T5 Orf172 DNA-binding domain-containing protein n=1 Tax=Aspergillus pseudoustus TaxID=1810923 RepID=A0ABR4KB58_9EURO
MAAAQVYPSVSSNPISPLSSLLHYPSLPSSNGEEGVQGPHPSHEGGNVPTAGVIGKNAKSNTDPRGVISEPITASDDKPGSRHNPQTSVAEAITEECLTEAAGQSPDRIECLDSQRFRWPIEVSVHELGKVLVSRQYKQKLGHAYVLFDSEGNAPYFKIGSSTNVTSRWSQHQGKCRLSGWDLQVQPSLKIMQCSRLERLAQTELKNQNCMLKCVCDVQHTEYYKGDATAGHGTLQGWSDWLVNYEPYGEDNTLRNFWLDRLDIFRSNIPRYFNCGDHQCGMQNGYAAACQMCVRTGWNMWTNPTTSERLEYACRTHIPYQWLRKITKWVGTGQEDTIRAYVELTGQMRRIVEPNFLYLMLLRLVVSVIWPSLMQGISERAVDAFLLITVMNLIVHPQYVEILVKNGAGSAEMRISPLRSRAEQSLTPEKNLSRTIDLSSRPRKTPSPRKALKKAVSSDDPFIEDAERTVITPRPGGKRISSAPSSLARPGSPSSSVVQPQEELNRKRRRSNQD